jgi:cell division protease FtsH
MLPEEDRVSMSETQLKDHLVVLLAGRSAETLIYDETAVGAENDLERATSMARRMVTRWGMSDKLGPVSYKLSDEDPFLGREMHEQRQFSEHTMEVIDSEVAALLHEAENRANDLLIEYRDELENLTQRLIAAEELSEAQIADTIGSSVHPMPKEDIPDRQDVTHDETAVMDEDISEEATSLLRASRNETEGIPSQQGDEARSDDDTTDASY